MRNVAKKRIRGVPGAALRANARWEDRAPRSAIRFGGTHFVTSPVLMRRRSVRSTRTAAFLKMPARGDIEARGEEKCKRDAAGRGAGGRASVRAPRRPIRRDIGRIRDADRGARARRRGATRRDVVRVERDGRRVRRGDQMKTTKETGGRDAPEHAPPFGGCCATTSASDVIARAASTASGGAMRYRALGVDQSGARPRRAAPVCMCPRKNVDVTRTCRKLRTARRC